VAKSRRRGRVQRAAPVAPRRPSGTGERDWVRYIEIVDQQLGYLAPSDVVRFINSGEYQFYRTVVAKRSATSMGDRKLFVMLVNRWMRRLSGASMQKFLATPDFKIYDRVERAYGSS